MKGDMGGNPRNSAQEANPSQASRFPAPEDVVRRGELCALAR
jgi:hypothetical protein